MRDSEVVASIVAGDPGGLGAAYDRYADPLFKYCQALSGDPADAADAVQDTFVIAATRLGGLRAPERLRSWLYAVARNESLRIVRARNGGPVLAAASGDSADVIDGAGRGDLRALFDDAMRGLTPGEREVVELQLRAGLAASEIADVLGVSADHAHTLLSRAREQLETCLGVLLVGRARRDHCAERASMLSGWDGRLTVVLRKRLHRHIRHCRTCTSMRGYQLRRSLPGLSASAALTTGAALSFRAADGPPEGLRGHTLALATGHGPTATAHSAAVLSRAGEFTRTGFPKATSDSVLAGRHAAMLAGRHTAVLAGRHGGMRRAAHGVKTGLSRTAARSSARSQAALTAAGVVAAAVAVAAIGLTGSSQRFTPTADPKAPATFGPVLSSASSLSSAFSAPSASRQPRTAALAPRKPAPATSKAAPVPTSTPPAVVSVPSPAPTSAPPPVSNTPPVKNTPPPPTHSPSPRPSPPPSPHPTPTPAGTLSAFPAGGVLVLEPGAPAEVTLSAAGGTVNWSIAVGNDPEGAVSVSPDSGTLTAGSPSATVTVTVTQYLDCGWGPGSPGACPTITISPSGTVYSIWTGHHHHHGRHSQGSTAVPAATTALNVTAIYLTETRRTPT